MFTTQLWNQGLDTDYSRWDDFFKRYLSTLSSSDVEEAPLVNIWTNELGAKVAVKLPGYSSEEIDVSVHNASVTVKGGHKVEDCLKDKFERTIDLPFGIEASHVEAAYANGILTLTLPIAEAQKPRKISVN
ncbi:MAG: Hsp20/alpha crystallin family protein [Nitrospirae bacterium]|nr:Hsp20/alpha crystallin family protein [Nitrospirota bacterium]